MSVPCHDQRDFEFAQKHGLKMIQVINPPSSDFAMPTTNQTQPPLTEAYTGEGIHINSDFLNGLNNEQAKTKMLQFLEKKTTVILIILINCVIGSFRANDIGQNPSPFIMMIPIMKFILIAIQTYQ